MAERAERKGFSMMLDAELLARIDANALIYAGGNRTQYILSYLPETYEPRAVDSETKQRQAEGRGR